MRALPLPLPLPLLLLLVACTTSVPPPRDAGLPSDAGLAITTPPPDAGPRTSLTPPAPWAILERGNGVLPARRHVSAVVDRDNRLLLLGGLSTGRFHNDVWSLALSEVGPTWTRLMAERDPRAVSAPGGRAGAAAAYDPVENRVLWFGGEAHHLNSPEPVSAWFQDLWSLELGERATWRVLPAGQNTPYKRHHHAVVFRPMRDSLLLWGGLGVGIDFNRQYLLDEDVWQLRLRAPPSCVSTPGDSRQWCVVSRGPVAGPRVWSAATGYDAQTDALYVFGGATDLAGDAPGDALWRFVESSGWTRLSPTCDPTHGCPAARAYTAGAYVPRARAFVVHAGYVPGRARDAGFGEGEVLSDTWAYETERNRWRRLPNGLPRWGHAAVVDELGRFVVTGGTVGAPDPRTSALDVAALAE